MTRSSQQVKIGSTIIDGPAGWWREERAPLRRMRWQCARVRSSTCIILGRARHVMTEASRITNNLLMYNQFEEEKDKYKISAGIVDILYCNQWLILIDYFKDLCVARCIHASESGNCTNQSPG